MWSVNVFAVLPFAVHAILPEAFSKRVRVDLELCDLKINSKHI